LIYPAIPESRQPYHAGFGTGRGGGPELEHLLRSVRRFGKQSVSDLIRHYRMSGHKLSGVGVVAGSLIDPERIANEHVRIHALEGRLFRSVVEEAALRSALPFSIWRERELYAAAAEVLRQPERHVRSTVSALGEVVAGPWRVEQKAAAVAAWLVLAGPGESAQSTKGEVGGLPVIRRRRRS